MRIPAKPGPTTGERPTLEDLLGAVKKTTAPAATSAPPAMNEMVEPVAAECA